MLRRDAIRRLLPWVLALPVTLLAARQESCSCAGPTGGTRSPTACDVPPCADGQVRCQDHCSGVLEKGDRCTPTLDCAAAVCADGTSCQSFLGAFACLPAKATLAPCTPTMETSECAVGLFCEPTRDLRPARPGDPPGFCVPWRLEGDACVGLAGGRLTCEPGLACVGGYCRKPCTSERECPCEAAETCRSPHAVAPPSSDEGTYCIGCADVTEAHALCDALHPCCAANVACGLPQRHPGPNRCCLPSGQSCARTDDCCGGTECRTEVGRTHCCVPPKGACRQGDTCCGFGTCCDGACVTCDEPGTVLDEESCACVPQTCANSHQCPNGGKPDGLSCTCLCFDGDGNGKTCCPLGTRDCGDTIPRCVDWQAPCPPPCNTPPFVECGSGDTCCGYWCSPPPNDVCRGGRSCPHQAPVFCPEGSCCFERFPICCGAYCCSPGQTCVDGRCAG